MTNQDQIYCIYLDGTQYKMSGARPYQCAAFHAAEVFYADEKNNTLKYQFNNNGYIFTLKKHELASTYKMMKEDNTVQYLAQGDVAANKLLESMNATSSVLKETIPCPICGKVITYYARYPKMVCGDCGSKTVTATGEIIEFYNPYFLGSGFGSIVNGKKGEEHICYIYGKKCCAGEARFGGIVIQCCE